MDGHELSAAPRRIHSPVSRCGAGFYPHQVLAIVLPHQDVDHLRAPGFHELADIVRFDGKLSVAAVDQNGEFDAIRAAEVDDGIHGRPDGPAGIKDIIDEDNLFAVGGEGDIRGSDNRVGADTGPVIPVQGNVDIAFGDVDSLDFTNLGLKTLGQEDPSSLNADEGESVGAVVGFQNLMRHPGKNAVDVRGVQYGFGGVT